jgi:group I intron endonuclease
MQYQYTIYKLFFKGDDRVYIGKTRLALNKRRNSHIQMIKRGLHSNSRLCEAFKLYGQDAIIIEPLEVCSQIESSVKELYWMTHYDAINEFKGYNMQFKSTGSIAFNLTDEQKKKISDSRKGSIPSTEHRRRLREINLGKKLSEETKSKQRQWYKDMGGWSEEQKKMMAKSASYPRSEETKNRMALGTEIKCAEMRGITLERWREIKLDAVNDWKINGMSTTDVSNKYKVDKSMLYEWYKKSKNTQ